MPSCRTCAKSPGGLQLLVWLFEEDVQVQGRARVRRHGCGGHHLAEVPTINRMNAVNRFRQRERERDGKGERKKGREGRKEIERGRERERQSDGSLSEHFIRSSSFRYFEVLHTWIRRRGREDLRRREAAGGGGSVGRERERPAPSANQRRLHKQLRAFHFP